ncbi:MAG: SRPBCC family protein [Jatrophihabitans sp.]
MTSSNASGSVRISADPNTVYALLTDLNVLAELAEETAEMRWTKGSSAEVGAVFRGTNRNGKKTWSTTCTVVQAERGRRFSFDVKFAVVPIANWSYEITALDGSCTVTETTVDKRPRGFELFGGFSTGVKDRGAANAAHIEATLQRLKERAEAS